jgi:hypothetical protein
LSGGKKKKKKKKKKNLATREEGVDESDVLSYCDQLISLARAAQQQRTHFLGARRRGVATGAPAAA